jgi:hypothetical protein
MLNSDRAYSPFHAALGIATSRMLIHLRKFAARNLGPEVEELELPKLEVDPFTTQFPHKIQSLPTGYVGPPGRGEKAESDRMDDEATDT